jgi:hypothetical protein
LFHFLLSWQKEELSTLSAEEPANEAIDNITMTSVTPHDSIITAIKNIVIFVGENSHCVITCAKG